MSANILCSTKHVFFSSTKFKVEKKSDATFTTFLQQITGG